MSIILMILGLIGLFLFLMPLILYGTLSIGNATGLVVAVLLLVASLFYGDIKRYVKTAKGHIVMRIMTIIASIIIALAAVETGFMIHGALPEADQGGTVVILGCLVRGTTPSINFSFRLNIRSR